jgi:hypothetical protein
MAADGSDSASFTVRLVNQVMAPARQIKQAMGDVEKAFKSTQRAMAAPAPKRGGLSEWDKMVGGAKRSQAADFAKQQAALAKANAAHQQKQLATSQKLAQFHADHGLSAMLVEGGSEAAIGATVAVAAAAAAAAVAVAYIGYKFAEASVEAGIFAQKSELAIGFLTNSGAAAATQFDEVRHMAQGLGLQVEETIGSFERLLAMQFSIGKSKDLIKMASDMQAIGANGEEVQRILYAISEIKSMGVLQKRQERMLQMAGISGELIDAALMKKGGFKDHAGLDKARKGNKIGADVAIDAIMEAVMHKTHETKLGQAGSAFATKTLAGMQAQFSAGLENLYIDAGKRLLPGVTELANMAAGTLGKIMDDPELAQLGDFLVNEFDIFVLWTKANWPEIQDDLVTGAHAIEGGIRMIIECFDDATIKGKIMEGLLITLAVAMGLLAVASVLVASPLLLLIAIIGGLAYAAVVAIDWISTKIKALGEFLGIGGGGAARAAAPGVTGWGGVPMVDDFGNVIPDMSGVAANDNGITGVNASAGAQALQNIPTATEGGEPRAGDRNIDMSGMQVNLTVKEDDGPEALAQKIHSEVAKLLRQAS